MLDLGQRQTSRNGAPGLNFKRTGDCHYEIESRRGAGFKKEWDIYKQIAPLHSRIISQGLPLGANEGMENCFETGFGCRIGKNKRPNGGAVRRSILSIRRRENVANHSLAHGGVGIEEFAGTGVGIENARPPDFSQGAAESRFT